MSDPLSPRARALLNDLEARWGERSPRGPGERRYAALALELGATGEALVAPVLLSLLLEGHAHEVDAVGTALHGLLGTVGPEEVLKLEAVLRGQGAWNVSRVGPGDVLDMDAVLRAQRSWQAGWRTLKPHDLERFEPRTPAVLALFTCDPNGHVREAALRRLRGQGGGAAWPFVLVRLNDWVTPVRKAALAVVDEALGGVAPERLVRHLPLVARLEHVGRSHHGDFVRRAMARLGAPEVRAWLGEHLGELPAHTRREAYRRLLETPGEEARALVTRGLEDPDVAVRALVAGRVGALFQGEALRALLERMERSRTAFVRREAYVLWAQRFPDPTWRKLREALCDGHRQVREFAQYRLKGHSDVATVYRESLEEGPRLLGALAGLGETGRARDALLVERYLTHPAVKVRREAVRAFARLGGKEALERLRECFVDPSPSVTRAVAAELAHEAGRVSLGWLRRWLAPGTPAHVRRAAMGLWSALPHWDMPLLLVEASVAGDERMARALGLWLASNNRRSVPPAREQLQALRDAVRGAPGLDEALRLKLNHLLRAFEPF